MPSQIDPLRKGLRYPGRDRVFSRDDARDILWRGSLELSERDLCEHPYVIHGIGLPSFIDDGQSPLPVEIPARCRKCEACLRHRRRLWTARAVDEIEASERTWFGTLTVAPAMRFQLDCEVEHHRLAASGDVLGQLSHSEQYRYRADYLGQEVTRYFKRLRKQTAGLRYLLVFESHKDGFPHCHLLLHEAAQPIRKAMLESQWRFGFSHWRLVDREPKAAVYACKYLANI